MTGEASAILSFIVGCVYSAFSTMDSVSIWENFTWVDIVLTFFVIEVILYAVLTYIGHPYERDDVYEGVDAHDPWYHAEPLNRRMPRFDARFRGGKR